MHLDEIYIFYLKYFSKFPLLTKINGKNHNFMGFFMVFIIKFKFAPIFTIIFVISASKYISIRSPETIGLTPFSEVHPLKLLQNVIFNCCTFRKFWGRKIKNYFVLFLTSFPDFVDSFEYYHQWILWKNQY